MTARITLALLFAIPAALAYPWRTAADRWLLGVAVAVVVVLFAWWRGLFVTEMVRRRVAIWRRNRRGGEHSRRPAEPGTYVASVLRVEPSSADGLPLPLIAGYVDRYGVKADKIRIVSRDRPAERSTWIAVTVGAPENLAALQARSPELPLRQTADVVARRLADHLREVGWRVAPVEGADLVADTPVAAGVETWRGLRTESGYIAAYRLTVDDRLPETLAAVTAHEADEIWTAIDITGTATHSVVTAGCALVGPQRPDARAPIAGLVPAHGDHRRALEALAPTSVTRLAGRPTSTDLVHRLTWPVDRRPTGELAEAVGPLNRI
ncbi:type VII secretion protein EccE [Mycobacterium sp. WMMD1722]|uniref:type VII secretion protein EccE n=1 Tax=Mycobacterium sp. WMMD1722 TaxID=3404117 RepID=UPI003BF4F78A